MNDNNTDGVDLTEEVKRADLPAADEESLRVEAAATPKEDSKYSGLRSGLMINLGMFVALAALCIVGIVTAGERFTAYNNVMSTLTLAATIGVVSIGMTFVITAGGIDLSVGAIIALSSVWSTTVATQTMAEDIHWTVIAFTALLVGGACGLVNGLVIAYGKVVPFIATLALMASARGLAELISDKKTQIITDRSLAETVNGDLFTISANGREYGFPTLVLIFLVVAVLGWLVLNRTTFGRRTIAVGGNPEAARLAGVRVELHTVLLYVLLGVLCGLAAVMLLSRTSAGTSTHGNLYELDAIAAVVIGGTLLSGGRGNIVGTVLGVLIFNFLSNIFTLNNMTVSSQNVFKGIIIIAAVLLQQFLARRSAKAAVTSAPVVETKPATTTNSG